MGLCLASGEALAGTGLLDGHQSGINWPRIVAGVLIGLLACFAAIYLLVQRRGGRRLLTGASAGTIAAGHSGLGRWLTDWLSLPGPSELTVLEHKRLTASCDVVRLQDRDQEYLIAVTPGCVTVLRQQPKSIPDGPAPATQANGSQPEAIS
jgi:hypothetical protein